MVRWAANKLYKQINKLTHRPFACFCPSLLLAKPHKWPVASNVHCTVCVRSVPGKPISGASARSRGEASSGRTYPQVPYLLSASCPPAKPHEWPAASKVLKPIDLAAPYTSSSSVTNPNGASQQPPALFHELSPSPTSHSIAPHSLASYSPARPDEAEAPFIR